MPNKIDSNRTGLRFHKETSIGVANGSAVWKEIEVNSYSDFGAQTQTVARAPLKANRQRKKGVVVDLDAPSGFNFDLTQDNVRDALEGFMFAAVHAKDEDAVTSVIAASDTFNIASGGADYRTNDLILASGFPVTANNGLGKVTSSTATTVVSSIDLQTDTPVAASKIKRVGHEFASGDATLTVVSTVLGLNATTKNLTQLGLSAGEWVFLGGDAVGTQFATTACNGFYRVKGTPTATRIEFDKTPVGAVADAGTSKTIRIFFGDFYQNENDPNLLVQSSYQMERSLADAGYQYLEGQVPNAYQINLSLADKVTLDVGFIGLRETRTTTGGRKSGTFPTLGSFEAFNTSSDFSRFYMRKSDGTQLFAFVMEATLAVFNNVSGLKALGVLGSADVNVGSFDVSGEVTAYFSDSAAIDAVQNNSDVTLDFALCKNNAGIIYDVPLLTLGNGRLQVEKDQPIKIPLSFNAAQHGTLNTSLLVNVFDYLPTLAM
jgi:hypothetical protein